MQISKTADINAKDMNAKCQISLCTLLGDKLLLNLHTTCFLIHIKVMSITGSEDTTCENLQKAFSILSALI